MRKNFGKNISKNASCKYSQKRLSYGKESHLKLLQKTKQKTVQENIDLPDNKIAKKFQKICHRILQRQLKVKQKYIEEIYISPGKTANYW